MPSMDSPFYPNLDYTGEASISLTVDDQGAGGSGGAMTSAATLQVTIMPSTMPQPFHSEVQTVDLGSTLKLSTLTGNSDCNC